MDNSLLRKIVKKIVILLAIVCIIYLALTFIYNKNNPLSNKKDKFADLLLKDIAVGDQVDSDILRQYNCYFNSLTQQNLTSGATIANNYYVNNSAKIASKLNTLSTNIDTLMIQLNNDILNNIGENYARAHLLNKQREEMKKTLDDLPLKNI